MEPNSKRFRKLNLLPNNTAYDVITTPVGELVIFASANGLHSILWDIEYGSADCKKMLARFKHDNNHKIILETKKQLTEYFNGTRKKFDLPITINGTPFQQQAWQQLSKIPYGKTISYGEQARRLGDKNKARAVGLANGQNPIPIIIPCHRVIGSNGKLTGFGGGLDKKELLLELEI